MNPPLFRLARNLPWGCILYVLSLAFLLVLHLSCQSTLDLDNFELFLYAENDKNVPFRHLSF